MTFLGNEVLDKRCSTRGARQEVLDQRNLTHLIVNTLKDEMDFSTVEMTPFETAFLSPYPQLFLTGFNAEWGIEWTETDEAGQNKNPSKYQQENSY